MQYVILNINLKEKKSAIKDITSTNSEYDSWNKVSVLYYLYWITVHWLHKRISLLLGNTHENINRKRPMGCANDSQMCLLERVVLKLEFRRSDKKL